MTQPSRRWFRLLPEPKPGGVSCGTDGLFVGAVPLLERISAWNGADEWQPRSGDELDRDLSALFDLPISCSRKAAGIAAVARALNKGDLVLAQITALHLQIPDLPPLAKATQTIADLVDLAVQLDKCGLLKADWDPSKHPRWPAGSAGGTGGEFAPAGSGDDASSSAESLIPVQEAIPFPWGPSEIPIPRIGPLPLPPGTEVFPPPVSIPNSNPKEMPKNANPKDPRCVKEWEDAHEYCEKLAKTGKLNAGDDRRNRGFGKWMYECLMGQVSEDCGGSSTSAFDIVA